ncbi:hypothetical protein L9F63_004852 [Diploptera punctata]|uniref:Pre-C2HC domain-containing protein n=1 Tax=Diploptera punctata TaxID=6984 RepID=A0AAD7ZF82_DIPPU|nr:hypothetical protein L9F63_004852 [Diploptera punctata]
MDDEGFSLPLARHTARKNNTRRNNTRIETNLFELLDTDMEETPPSIVVHTDEITPYKLKCITAGNKKEVSMRYTQGRLTIRTTTKKAYQHAYKHLNDSKTAFYTHGYGKPPVIKITMKGLSITVQQVYNELIDRKLPLRKMRSLDKQIIQDGVKKRIKLPIHILTFDKTKDLKTRLKEVLSELFVIKVRLESYKKPTGGTQCFNCRGFGHICFRVTKCVRCSREHRVAECTQTTPKCCNCNQEHAVSFRQCPAF